MVRNIFCNLLRAGFLLGIFFGPQDGGYKIPPSPPATFTGLQDVIFQKTGLFHNYRCEDLGTYTWFHSFIKYRCEDLGTYTWFHSFINYCCEDLGTCTWFHTFITTAVRTSEPTRGSTLS
jgi:hypothetical protein